MPTLSVPYAPHINLDSRARRLANVHFDRKHGAPYWIDWQEKHGRDLVKEVDRWEDLLSIPPQPEDRLQPIWNGKTQRYEYNPPADLLLPRMVRETGMIKLHQSQSSGSTNPPKKCLWTESSLRLSLDSSDHYLDGMDVPRDVDWMVVGPPTLYQEYMNKLARRRGSNPPYFVQIPTEGIKPLFAKPVDQLDAGPQFYRRRITEDSVRNVRAYLEGKNNIKVMVALPFNIDDFAGIEEMQQLDTILFVGFGMGKDTLPRWQAAFPKARLLGFYTHYMNATAPFVPQDPEHLDYHAAEPLVHFDVATFDEKKPEEVNPVQRGERGRICFTRAGDDIFWRQWEDAATRIGPSELFPWDGVRDVDRYIPMKQ